MWWIVIVIIVAIVILLICYYKTGKNTDLSEVDDTIREEMEKVISEPWVSQHPLYIPPVVVEPEDIEIVVEDIEGAEGAEEEPVYCIPSDYVQQYDDGFTEYVQPKRSKGETICWQFLEKHFGVPFIRARPKWLRNPKTGYLLELDCYNEGLKLAVEYNGEQHYVWPNFFNVTYQSFLDMVGRDAAKRSICEEMGVYLIVVPYTVKHKDIEEYILQKLYGPGGQRGQRN